MSFNIFKVSSKLFLPIIAIIIILFLIFLPEIIGIKSIDNSKEEIAEVSETEPDLDQAEKQLTGEVAENQAPTPNDSNAGFEGLGLKIGRFLSDRSGKSVKRQQNNSAVSQTKFTSTQLNSWEAIKDPLVQNNLQNNLQLLDKVLTNVSVRYQSSRKELLKFKQILTLLIQPADENSPKPQDLIDQLEKQDLQVTTSLLQELVPINILELWAIVNLSSFYESNLPQRLKILTISSFNPRLQIHDATFYLVQNSASSKESKLQSIGLNFALLKEGVREVKLFKNNILVGKMALKSDRGNNDWSTFQLDVTSGKDIYSIYAYGNNNQIFVKHYRFSENFETLSLKAKEVKKQDRLQLLYASAENNTVGQLNLIDELYSLRPKGSQEGIDLANMEKF